MDGRGQIVLIDTEIYSPTALTIDYTNQRLYWADDNHILFANMDGSQRHKGEALLWAGSEHTYSISTDYTFALSVCLYKHYCSVFKL